MIFKNKVSSIHRIKKGVFDFLWIHLKNYFLIRRSGRIGSKANGDDEGERGSKYHKR
jgi:hypothetical protein